MSWNCYRTKMRKPTRTMMSTKNAQSAIIGTSSKMAEDGLGWTAKVLRAEECHPSLLLLTFPLLAKLRRLVLVHWRFIHQKQAHVSASAIRTERFITTFDNRCKIRNYYTILLSCRRKKISNDISFILIYYHLAAGLYFFMESN